MKRMLTNLLYRLGGTVPAYIAPCPASEQQLYRALAYAQIMVGLFTALAAHHAARLWGVADPAAWVAAITWAGAMLFCTAAVVTALAKRTSWVALGMRLVLLLLNAIVLAFFAVLAANQPVLARIRFEEKQRALMQDRSALENEYRLKDRTAALAGASADLAAIEKKLAITPPPIQALRTRAALCVRHLDSMRLRFDARRTELHGRLAGVLSQIARARSARAPETLPDVPDLEAQAERVRGELRELDGRQRLEQDRCGNLSAALAELTRKYYGPLRQEKASAEQLLTQERAALTGAEGHITQGMAQSRRVSDAAFGFNIAAEGRALVEYLAQTWLAPAVALVVFLGSIAIETLPLGLKLSAGGGPYDQLLRGKENEFTSQLEYDRILASIQGHAELEHTRRLMPKAMQIKEPITLFMMNEAEVAKARHVREGATKADPSRVQELDEAFNDAVTRTRAALRHTWHREREKDEA